MNANEPNAVCGQFPMQVHSKARNMDCQREEILTAHDVVIASTQTPSKKVSPVEQRTTGTIVATAGLCLIDRTE
jgi:hypothetical protein